MSYTRHVEHFFQVMVIGLVSVIVNSLWELNKKFDTLSMTVHEVTFRYDFLELKIAEMKRECTERRRL